MRAIEVSVLATMLLAATVCAHAKDERQVVGSWLIDNKEDRFGNGGTFIAAVPDVSASANSGTALVVRCIEKDLSIALLDSAQIDPKPLKIGTAYVVKLRTDTEPVMTTVGKAINERLIQVETQADMVRTIRKGRETAIRLENSDGVSRTIIFQTKGNAKALARIAAECKLD
ncbi:hypothetical protein QA640_17635 [Bradyrhizobium sp. CB82]|uniref:hypothetical protein n=1 Tax=Bradyrhizobium sp. CB82 TaxID=3039159 RepID=UPI0024B202B7|nr:hypothetical protein [Bradyrhizobium sp. CB82]WFU44106.1 hypothetical protein QA640_17635 [Bradyrhizobium sp. CB82]